MSVSETSSIVTESLPDAINSTDLALTHIKYSFIAGIGLFVILFPFYRSRKSCCDAIAARKLVRFARFFILIEILLLFILYYFYFEYGRIIKLHALLDYGNGDSWLYSAGRPTGGLIFIPFGLWGEVHPLFRILCMIGCMGQIMGDALSAAQVRDYYQQVKYDSAPDNGYSLNAMLAYYWRDIISLGISTTVLMMSGLLCVVVGWCEPQLIHPSLIGGLALDRRSEMRQMRGERRLMESRGLMGPRDLLRLGKKKAVEPAASGINSSGNITVAQAIQGSTKQSATTSAADEDNKAAADVAMEEGNQGKEGRGGVGS